jgi:hypothetical protein
VNKGARVTRNGKLYEVAQVMVDTKPRAGVDWTGQTVLWVKPINPKTGRPWQAGMERPATEFEVA